MTPPSAQEDHSHKSALLIGLARGAIERALGRECAAVDIPENLTTWLRDPAATFVTLDLDSRLRGCIGTLDARKPLIDDVEANARAAAFDDPRFPALRREELEGLGVEVSILSATEHLECRDEAELVAQLRPGVDGLILECGEHRSTFLPQVWRDLPEPGDFVAALKRKAGLEPGFWSGEMRFARYTVEKYRTV